MKKAALPLLSSLSIAVLVACGGGGGGGAGGSSSTTTISGTTASGAAIVGGSVEVKCATGTGTATTGSDGSYSVSIANAVAPCLLKVTSTNANNEAVVYHSAVDTFASGAATANLSPLSELVMTNALGGTPSQFFASGVTSDIRTKIDTNGLSSAVASIQTAAPNLGINLSGIDPLKSTLVADTGTGGNAQDKAIDGLMVALTSSGKSVGDIGAALVTAKNANQTPAQAFTTFATNNSVSTSALSGCPSARSGKYLLAGPGDQYFSLLDIDFSNNQGSFKFLDTSSRTPRTFTISQADPTNKPCVFSFTSGGTVNVVMSSSGVGVFSKSTNAFPDNTNTAAITGQNSQNANFVGLALPVQRVVAGQFDGTFTGIAYYKLSSPSNSAYKVAYNKNVTSGTSHTSYNCNPMSTAADPCTFDTTETSSPDADTDSSDFGLYTSRSSPNSPYYTKSALYRSPQGDRIVVSIITGPSVTNAFAVATNRSTDLPAPVTGNTQSNYEWVLINNTNSPGFIFQRSSEESYRIGATSGSSFQRIRTTPGDSNGEVNSVTLNSPARGMVKVGAGTSSPAGIGITIQGLTIFASANPNASAASDHYFGFSVRR